MKLLTSVIVALTAALVSCSPIEIEALATHSCVCGTKSFTNADIVGTVNKGYTTNPNPTTSSGAYPHGFHNSPENFSFPWCSGGNYVEFPLKTLPAYTPGNAPGADRVIYQTGSAKTFCGCITHTGASGNGFVLCKNS